MIQEQEDQSDNFNDALRLLLRGARELETLPHSYYLTDVELNTASRVLSGTGGFGDVYRAKWKGGDVALKTFRMFISLAHEDRKRYIAFLREIIIWRQLSHPNIQQFLGVNHEVLAPRLAVVSKWEWHGNINNVTQAFELERLMPLRPKWVCPLCTYSDRCILPLIDVRDSTRS